MIAGRRGGYRQSRLNWPARFAASARAGYRIGTALRRAWSGSRTGTQTRRTTGNDTGALTHHHDDKTIYRKGRVNRRRAKKARRFARSVNKVLESAVGQRSFTNAASVTVVGTDPLTVSTCQAVNSAQLYSWFSGGQAFYGDLYYVYKADAGTSFSTPMKYQFYSAIMNITVQNLGTVGGSTSVIPLPLQLDVYYVVSRKDGSIAAASDYWIAAQNDEVKLPNAVSKPTPSFWGATPFECPQWCREWYIKKTRRFIIPPGDSINFQYRDGRHHRTTYEVLVGSETDARLARITTGVMIVGTGISIGTHSTPTRPDYNILKSVTYHYGVNQDQTDYIGFAS